MAKIVFMGTPQFAVPALQALMAAHTVTGVVTQPDRPAGRGRQLQPSPVKVVAEAAGLPVYQPASLRSEAATVPIRDWEPDIIIVAAFGQLLRPHVLDLPPHGCLNVHASLLPRWRGASPIQHAILAGDAQTGITLMKMDVGLDTGPIYVQQAISIRPDETAASLHDRLAELGGLMLTSYLDDIIQGHIQPVAQDDAQATYAPLIKKEDGLIEWSRSSLELDRRIRAMTPWPGAYTTWQGSQLKILSARPVAHPLPEGRPGRVVSYQNAVIVLAGDGGLELQQVQLAGKRAVPINDFIHGRPDFINSILGT